MHVILYCGGGGDVGVGGRGGVVISCIYTEYSLCWTACCRVGNAAVATHLAELSTEK